MHACNYLTLAHLFGQSIVVDTEVYSLYISDNGLGHKWHNRSEQVLMSTLFVSYSAHLNES
jgi:hypothetical protein